MTGFGDIAREVKTKCPKCNSSLDLEEVGQMFFDRILEHLQSGERVQISGFGAFSAKPMKAREIQAFGETKTMAPRLVIRFKASEIAKAKLNKREPRTRDQPKPAAVKKKAVKKK